MPVLKKARHEKFAQKLSKGKMLFLIAALLPLASCQTSTDRQWQESGQMLEWMK